LSDMFADTAVAGGGLTTNCQLSAYFEVKVPNGPWVNSSNPYFSKLINTATGPATDAKTSSLVLKASVAEYGAGISTSKQTISIKVTYSMPGQSDSKTFDVDVLPSSALVKLYSDNTN
jgi:hypothetical protein